MMQEFKQNSTNSDLDHISEKVLNLTTENTELIEDEEAAIDNAFMQSKAILQSLTELASHIESNK